MHGAGRGRTFKGALEQHALVEAACAADKVLDLDNVVERIAILLVQLDLGNGARELAALVKVDETAMRRRLRQKVGVAILDEGQVRQVDTQERCNLAVGGATDKGAGPGC